MSFILRDPYLTSLGCDSLNLKKGNDTIFSTHSPPPQIKWENGYESTQESVRYCPTVSRANTPSVYSDTITPGVTGMCFDFSLTRAIFVVQYFDYHSWVWDNTLRYSVSTKKDWDQDKGLVFIAAIRSFTSVLLNSKIKHVMPGREMVECISTA